MSLLQRERRLAARRCELLQRSQRQRDDIAQAAIGLQPTLAVADQALQIAQRARRHAPWIALAVGALIAIKRPRGALKLALRAWTMWRTMQALR